MKQVILDTNFILSCVRKKIDFLDEIEFMGFQILIPIQVIGEIKKIIDSKKKLHFKEDAKLALKILSKNNFEKIDLNEKYVDKGLMEFAEKNKEVLVATLDKELKKKIKNNILIIRGRKKLEIV